MEQNLTKHTIGKDKELKKKYDEEAKSLNKSQQKKAYDKIPTTVTSKVTKRPHMKIMDKVKQKIASKLAEKIGIELGGVENIVTFLNDKIIHNQIKELIKLDRIQLTDQEN